MEAAMSRFRIFLTFLITFTLLASGSTVFAEGKQSNSVSGPEPKYSVQWVFDEKQAGLSLSYSYAGSRSSTGKFSVPTVNKAGNTYMVAHDRNDIRFNSIICLDRNGKVKWRKDFKENELDVRFNYIHTDHEGNLYYLTTERAGKKRTQIAHSLTPDGAKRWTFTIPKNEDAELALVGNGDTIVATNTKLYMINPKGKVKYTKDLPQTPNDNLSFLTAYQGKIVYYRTVYNKDKFVDNEFQIYSSDNKLLAKVYGGLGFGEMKYKIIRFFDNGDFLHITSYGRMNQSPAVLKMYDSRGKQKWKKIIYSDFSVDEVFIAGRNIYYYPGIFNPSKSKELRVINANTGEEKGSYPLADGFSNFFAGFDQEVIRGSESLISTENRDLTQAKDLFIYEINGKIFKKLDPNSLKVVMDYSESLKAFMLDSLGVGQYSVKSARNNEAYIYFTDPQTKKQKFAKVKIG